MTKTTEVLIEKNQQLISGLRRHIKEMGERGVTLSEIEELEQKLSLMLQQSEEVDKLREELANKVNVKNETMSWVKSTYTELKKTLKGYYPQERWMDYGIPDKR